MALQVKVRALCNQLVETFNGQKPNAAGVVPGRRGLDAAELFARSLKAAQQQHIRTNQFEVYARLHGLKEKFFVLGRDDLASALETQLEDLKEDATTWIPDVLALLLELSDRPAEKVDFDSGPSIETPSADIDKVQTWDEIFADDPPSDAELWEKVDYADSTDVDSADEEEIVLSSAGINRPRFVSLSRPVDVDQLTIPIDESLLDAFIPEQAATGRHAKHEKVEIAESCVIRDSLAMLRGLPTSTFSTHSYGTVSMITVDRQHQTVSLGAGSIKDLSAQFAALGTSLLTIRAWLRKGSSDKVLQRVQDAMARVIARFECRLDGLEQQLSGSPQTIAVNSLLRLETAVSPFRNLFERLELVVTELYHQSSSTACLDLLHDEVTWAEATGEQEAFSALLEIFNAALEAYLRPIQQWMLSGEVDGRDRNSFITSDGTTDETSNKPSQYRLRLDNLGNSQISKFIDRETAEQILQTGISVNLALAMMSKITTSGTIPSTSAELEISAITLERSALPFPEYLAQVIRSWVDQFSSPVASRLVGCLWHKSNFADSLDALEYLYFSKDGSAFQQFADSVFAALEGITPSRQDAKLQTQLFVLTETTRKIFAPYSCIDSSCLSVSQESAIATQGQQQTRPIIRRLSSLKLNYRLTGAHTMIIDSLSIPQRVLTLLLQVYWAKYAIRHDNLIPRTDGKNDIAAVGLRQRLLWFIDVFHAYITDVVFAPAISQVRARLLQCEDLPALRVAYADFLRGISSLCLLDKNVRAVLDSVIGIFQIAESFKGIREDNHTAKDEKARASQTETITTTPVLDSYHESDKEHSDDDYDADTETKGRFGQHSRRMLEAQNQAGELQDARLPYADQIAAMRRQFAQLSNFVLSGLRGISRTAGAESAGLEVLAERLEWGMMARS